jgi:HEAT repeat protein
LELTFDIQCGQARHPVSLTLMAWGTFKVMTPCDSLPETARRLAGSNCEEALNNIQQELRQQLQQCLYADGQVAAQVKSITCRLPGDLKEVAEAMLQSAHLDETDVFVWLVGAFYKAMLQEAFDGEQEVTNEMLRTALNANDPFMRWAAAVMAGKRQEPSFVTALIERTKDTDFGVQVAAVWALTRTEGAEAVPVLIEWLLNEQLIPKLREEIAGTLGRIGDPRAVEPLIEAFTKGEANEVRNAAVRALGQIGDPRAVEHLVEVMKTDEDKEIQKVAIRALGEIRDPSAVGPLIEALQCWFEEERAAIEEEEEVKEKWRQEALRRVDYWSLTIDLKGSSEEEKERLEEILGYGYEYEREMPHPPKGTRETIEEALVRIGVPAAARLIDILSTVHADTATELLVRIGPPSIPLLIAALRGRAVVQAVEVLVQIGAPTVEPLIQALKDERGYAQRAAAAALGRIHDPRAVDALIEALKDEDQDMRQTVARALGRIGDPRAVDPLIEVLSDKNANLRVIAAKALVQIGDPAIEAIAKIGISAIDPLLEALKDTDYYVRKAVAKALARFGASAVTILIEVLRNEDENVREAAQEALMSIGATAIEPLAQALRDADKCVRKAAAKTLGEIGDPRAVELLVEALQDLSVQKEVIGALERIGEPAFEQLLKMLSDADTQVRTRAAKAFRLMSKCLTFRNGVIGLHVEHQIFGTGIVIDIECDREPPLIVVRFDGSTVDVKRLVLGVAPLLWDDSQLSRQMSS